MTQTMTALVYEAPREMHPRDVPVPAVQPDEVLVKVAYSGICGSELSGFEGKNALRKPPLIMGHEFSGTLAQIGERAQARFPQLQIGSRVTANPLISCGRCTYCLSGRQQLCPERKLHSATLPGSNAQFIAIRADAIHLLPEDLELTAASLAEPSACAIHAARIAAPHPDETGLVVGAGTIGLLVIQALLDRGMKTIYCADLNAERLAMAESLGALPVNLDKENLSQHAEVVVDAVGASSVRHACVTAARSGGRIIWVGLHEPESPLPINDMIRREITAYGSFGYTPIDFQNAITALEQGRLWLVEAWTRIEPLARGTACFEELLHGAPVAKIWLQPPE
jgi:2-desacetyl-2-hydroxyethyl bacteriochlorophyllide A dehydrogenase